MFLSLFPLFIFSELGNKNKDTVNEKKETRRPTSAEKVISHLDAINERNKQFGKMLKTVKTISTCFLNYLR